MSIFLPSKPVMMCSTSSFLRSSFSGIVVSWVNCALAVPSSLSVRAASNSFSVAYFFATDSGTARSCTPNLPGLDRVTALSADSSIFSKLPLRRLSGRVKKR